MAILYSRLRSPLFIEKTGSGSTYLSADMTITINSTVRYVLSKDTDSSYKVTAIVENNLISSNEQNTDFSTLAADFLDFSEDNPFGDPENN